MFYQRRWNAYHPIACLFKQMLAFGISFPASCVDRAVNLYNQSLFGAEKVYDKRADRLLTTKFPLL
jgi:hypothetical protein